MAARKRRRKGTVSEAKREQGRQLAARMKRENGKFVGLGESEDTPAQKPAAFTKTSTTTTSTPVAPTKKKVVIKTANQELVDAMEGRGSQTSDYAELRHRRRLERGLRRI